MNIAKVSSVIALLALSSVASTEDGAAPQRYAHRGEVYRSLPREAVAIQHRGAPYYYRGGEWYRPYGSRFMVIAPPLGAVAPFLPGVYTTFWFGGIPYYFANDAYYLWRPELNGYVVTSPPSDVTPTNSPPAAPVVSEPFVYPKNGQSESQQATDRYECHRWAADKSSFDPTQPAAGNGSSGRGAAEYTRAMSACLEGRGYSVK